MSSKKIKIYCYKLAKPVAKSLMKNLKDKVGRIEYNRGFIKENLGNTYLITLDKLKKGDEIILSNDFKFLYGGSLSKKINYIPYESNGVNASDGNFIVMPSKEFLEIVDPNNTCIETIILDDIINKIFQEESNLEIESESKAITEDIPEPEITDIISEDQPVVSQVTIEEQEPIMSTDPFDGTTLVLNPEDFQEELPKEVEEELKQIYSENPEEWFEEEKDLDVEELSDKIRELEMENFKLSNKINNTIEELKNMSILDILFWKWKTKLLDILNL